MRKIERYGWRPDHPDHRDYLFIPSGAATDTPADWRPFLPPAYDQGQLGTCTCHSAVAAFQCNQKLQGKSVVMPSRLFLYWNSGVIEGTQGQDVGRENRDVLLSLVKDGVCPETMWPYGSYQGFKPNQNCYSEAERQEVLEYSRVDNTDWNTLLEAIRTRPVIFGFSVPQSFEGNEIARTGVMEMPKDNEPIVGGHSVLAIGDEPDRILVRNSWGEHWGQSGNFWMPRSFITDGDWCNDFWMVKRIT